MTVTRDDPRLRPPRPRAPVPRGAPEGSGARPPAGEERNAGTPLDLDFIRSIRINRSAVERRAATLPARRSVKQEWQAAWLLRAVTCIDLTTLQGDDTPGNVQRLCAKARQPVRLEILEALGATALNPRVGAVCVYHNLIPAALQARAGSGVPVAAVSSGFPAGQTPLELKLREVAASTEVGAAEIDVVISRAHVLRADYRALYDEVRAIREACGPARLKVILGTG